MGDKLRFTQNGMTACGTHRLNNGAIYSLAGFSDDGNLVLNNGWHVDSAYGNLTHGYCTTSHASQGKTVDHVYVAQGPESNPASSAEQFYVSVSRARERVRIYTQDKTELKDAVARDGSRPAAVELQGPRDRGVLGKFIERATLVNRLAYHARAVAGTITDKTHELVERYSRRSQQWKERILEQRTRSTGFEPSSEPEL